MGSLYRKTVIFFYNFPFLLRVVKRIKIILMYQSNNLFADDYTEVLRKANRIVGSSLPKLTFWRRTFFFKF